MTQKEEEHNTQVVKCKKKYIYKSITKNQSGCINAKLYS